MGKNKLVSCFLCGCALLAACSPVSERRERVRGFLDETTETASGAVSMVGRHWHAFRAFVSGVVKFGQDTANNVQEGFVEVEQRVQKIQDGVEKIQEGKELLEEGLQKK
ncbi:hypothetical protein HYZ98_01105 [Candidatus Peregrinibacteria bacterium]|nr:hypothetical protein [Candidatus Peregrinibacteria bacterium]